MFCSAVELRCLASRFGEAVELEAKAFKIVQSLRQDNNPVAKEVGSFSQTATVVGPCRGQEDPVLYNDTDELGIEDRHLTFRRGRYLPICQAVVRFPKFEEKLDLPPRSVQNHHLFPGQQSG